MRYAVIEDGVVVNVIALTDEAAGDFPNAVPMGDIPAGIGDTYENGAFYRNGAKVLTHAEAALATLETAFQAYMEGVNEA